MRFRLVLILVALLLLLAPALYAQESEDAQWYFAVGNQGELFAYSTDGAVNTLIEDGVGVDAQGWRLDEQSALAMLSIDMIPTLYTLTPDAAQPLTLSSGVTLPGGSNALTLAARSDRYLVFILPPEMGTMSGLLVDLDTQTASALLSLPYMTFAAARFSAEGQYLRFFSRDEDDQERWTLWERDLATGDDRAVYPLAANQISVSADRYGERWLTRVRNAETGLLIHTLINIDGSSEVLAAEGLDDLMIRQLVGDWLLAYPLSCESGCDLEAHSLDGGEPVLFPMPATQDIAAILARPDETHLLIRLGSTFWFLEQDGEPTQIGSYNPRNMIAVGDFLSPGDRWLLTVDDPDQPAGYSVWDNLNAEVVLSSEGSDTGDTTWLVRMIYGRAGLLVNRILTAESELYRYSDGEVIALPAQDSRIYFEVLSDNILLFNQVEQQGAVAPGIYLYDLAADEYSLLVPDAMPILLQDAQP